MKSTLTTLTDYPRYGCPFKRGNAFYYFHNSGLLPQSVLYKQDSLTEPERVFFDPNKLSKDGTVSLNTYSFSESGRFFAYGLSESGSDWVKVSCRSTDDDKPHPIDEPLEWVKFTSLSWTHDDKGFFYIRFPCPKVSLEKAGTETDRNSEASIYFHQLGTTQSQDILIYNDPTAKDDMVHAEVTEDGKYLIVSKNPGCEPQTKVYYLNLQEWQQKKCASPPLIPVVE
jgi:prolyl oligopeptidase